MSNFSRLFLNIRSNIEQWLPAQPCLLCGAPSRHGSWCDACERALPRLPAAHCPSCALPTPSGAVCGRCLNKPPHFDHTVAPYAYAFPLDKLIHAFKFGAQLQLAHQLARQIADTVEQRPDCIVPMPLHPARLRERGYNQSLLLARELGAQLELPVLAQACQRTRNTAPQSELPWKERGRNMRKAFAASDVVSGKHVAVVDDVMTTGATLNELAQALRRAGATGVSNWVVARTLPHAPRR